MPNKWVFEMSSAVNASGLNCWKMSKTKHGFMLKQMNTVLDMDCRLIKIKNKIKIRKAMYNNNVLLHIGKKINAKVIFIFR